MNVRACNSFYWGSLCSHICTYLHPYEPNPHVVGVCLVEVVCFLYCMIGWRGCMRMRRW